MHVTLPDATRLELTEGATGADAAAAIGPGLARAALAVTVDGELRDLSAPLPDGASLEVVTDRSPQALELIRHDAAHVLATAVMELYPGVKISIGPPIEQGFYYDFEFPDGAAVSDADLERIEARMREHVEADEPFVRDDVTPGEALERFARESQDYKVELIEDLVRDQGVETVSLYTNGPFTDLCRGPHGPSTKRIKAFKLQSLAGAYWRGDASRTQLTRIYGTAFLSAGDLAEHLERLEQARARDHRRIGRELELFLTSELSPGSPFWLPNGTQMWNELTRLWRSENVARGYTEVRTPLLYDVELWRQSGHWDVYRDHMYFTDVEDRPMGLKPMNCPAHVQLFKAGLRSYRDLPIRYAEQGLVHRHEPSGTLHGLLRVRHITQDDAHMFCTEEQLGGGRGLPATSASSSTTCSASSPGWSCPRARRSGWAPTRCGTAPRRVLERALRGQGLEFDLNEGDGAFYGPKIDLHMTDSIGRSWQLGHGAAGLLHARALRAGLHRRRQRRAPAGDDPPRPDGLVRALHRDPDRALRGRVPGLAGAGAGDRAADRRPPRRVRGQRASSTCGKPACAPSSTSATSRSAARSARPSCARCPTCWWWATARQEAGAVSVREHRKGDAGSASLAEFTARVARQTAERSG